VPRAITNGLLVLACLALIVPAVLLACGVLPYRVYVVHTGSMNPSIPPKSAVIVRAGAYRIGQVISFITPEGVVTHRLVRRNADGTLVTRGDANRSDDPGSVRPSQVIGGVVAAPPTLGYWLVFLRNPAGQALIIVVLVCLWLLQSIAAEASAREAKREGTF
jgi:signal peptidase I